MTPSHSGYRASTTEAYVAMVSQRSGRMLSVGAKRLPMWGGPLPTLAIAILSVLCIKYVKQVIRNRRGSSSNGRATDPRVINRR